MKRVTVIGAGLAGLSAAVSLVRAGAQVRLVDAGPRAGGRCRSYHDPQLGLTIDNGNHLVLSGNPAVARFRAAVGADPATLSGPDHADFAFADLRSGERWTVRVNDGPLPWWVLSSKRRVPGTRAREYLALGRLMHGGGTVADRIATRGPLWERFLEPVLVSALNVPAATGSARLTAGVLRETVAKGGRAMRPLVAGPTLAAAFIDPAVDWLAKQGVALETGRRLRAIGFAGDRAASLDWGSGPEPLADDEAAVLAAPAWIAADLVPGLTVPDQHRAIVNAHFAHVPPPGAPPLLGLVGGTAEWVFAFPDRLSVTVSAADRLLDTPREELAQTFWAEITRALGVDAPLPAWQIVKEKRATFAATPDQDAKRPDQRTRWRNLSLAGDWTQTGLPSTIEGALRSGEKAAAALA